MFSCRLNNLHVHQWDYISDIEYLSECLYFVLTLVKSVFCVNFSKLFIVSLLYSIYYFVSLALIKLSLGTTVLLFSHTFQP